MRRKTEGLEPHKESKIVLNKIDKLIFAVGAAGYGITVILEEKSGRRNALSSSIAILAVGLFMISRTVQTKKSKELIFTKEKLLFLLLAAGGVLLSLFGAYSLVIDIIKLIS